METSRGHGDAGAVQAAEQAGGHDVVGGEHRRGQLAAAEQLARRRGARVLGEVAADHAHVAPRRRARMPRR